MMPRCAKTTAKGQTIYVYYIMASKDLFDGIIVYKGEVLDVRKSVPPGRTVFYHNVRKILLGWGNLKNTVSVGEGTAAYSQQTYTNLQDLKKGAIDDIFTN